MDHEIQLISDGNGLAVIGNPAAVERFFVCEGLPPSEDLGLSRLGSVLCTGAAAAQAGSEIAASSGRWVRLTKESAQLVRTHGLRESSKTGLSTGVVKGSKGHVGGFVEFAKGRGSFLVSPALLAGAAGIMAQLAMQQAMDEITDYLAAIDEKVGDVLRAQKDAVLADMIGVDLVIEEVMTVRDHVGRVSEITWSKVQATSMTIARTHAYALRQLSALAEKVEHKAKIGDLAKTSREAESRVQEWLAVVAGCVQLQDAISAVAEFHGRLRIEHGRQALKARRWVDAAEEVKDKALETGAEAVDTARRLGNEALDRARSATDKLSSRIAQRALRRRGDDEERNEEG